MKKIIVTCIVIIFLDKEFERYASTADVMVGEGSVIQFELLMGCDSAKNKDQHCFGKYSVTI